MRKETDILRVANRLQALGGVSVIESNIEVSPIEFDDAGNALVAEDNDRDEWVAEFEFDRPFLDVTDALTAEFGEPTHPDGDHDINNWKVGRALVVHGANNDSENGVSVYQRFSRR